MMKNLRLKKQSRSRAIALGMALALGLGACATQEAPAAITARQFADGWQAHTAALIYRDGVRRADTAAWMVPGNLASGAYQVITHEGNNAELIDGHRFVVTSDSLAEISVILPATYMHVEVVQDEYVRHLN